MLHNHLPLLNMTRKQESRGFNPQLHFGDSINYFSNTDLGKISISGEVETGKVHGETTVHVHVHISSGAGSAVVQVVLPKEKKIR